MPLNPGGNPIAGAATPLADKYCASDGFVDLPMPSLARNLSGPNVWKPAGRFVTNVVLLITSIRPTCRSLYSSSESASSEPYGIRVPSCDKKWQPTHLLSVPGVRNGWLA